MPRGIPKKKKTDEVRMEAEEIIPPPPPGSPPHELSCRHCDKTWRTSGGKPAMSRCPQCGEAVGDKRGRVTVKPVT